MRCFDGKEGVCLIKDTLPKVQVQEPQFKLHISYFLQKCKKSRAKLMTLPQPSN